MAAFTGSPWTHDACRHDTLPEAARAGRTVFAEPIDYTHLAARGAGTGEINLCRLPPGAWTISAARSVLAATQFATSATLAIGIRATTAAAEAAWLAAIDVASGVTAMSTFATLGASDAVVESTEPITIFATVAAGNIETNDTIQGVVVYSAT